MQSSEGGFNTRYPREPNGITDPEYSIQCGVQELKSCLVSAGVENPIDMQNIKLALQGYNFGNGYISWAKSNYGGYTAANAAEFSDMMAQRMGGAAMGTSSMFLMCYGTMPLEESQREQAAVRLWRWH